MREAVGDGVAALCLGWIAVWAGEHLFWTTPAPDLRLVDLGLTWAACGVAAVAAGLGLWVSLLVGAMRGLGFVLARRPRRA